MPDYLCHACKQKRSNTSVQQCDKCKKILCDSCRSGKSTCKDSTKGTAGCSGHFKRL